MSAVPSLPDDLLLMIFDNLSSKERLSLATSCKKFRDLDFELGKRVYQRISINFFGYSLFKKNQIDSTICTTSDQFTHHDIRHFRYARTEELEISINKIDCTAADLQKLLTILRTVIFSDLTVKFELGNDISGDFLSSLLRNVRNFNVPCVNLSFENVRAPEDIPHLRKTLWNLPELLTFEMVEKFPLAPHYGIVNDEILLHIIAMSQFIKLEKTACTTQGIANAWKLICESTESEKRVEFHAPTAEVEPILSLPGMCFEAFGGPFPTAYRFSNYHATIFIRLKDTFSYVCMRKQGKQRE